MVQQYAVETEETPTLAAHRADTRTVEAVDPSFRGFKFGAAFFGWLIAVAITVLLAGVVGAIATGVDYAATIDWAEMRNQAGTVGIVSGALLLVVMALAYYTGGYVAGRLARFDGGRQGFGVWVIGLLVTLVVAGVGAFAGNEYNVLDRVEVPTLSLSTDTLTAGGLILAGALLLVTLLAAIVGGKAGLRYHRKIDTSWN
ncbi:hypothetical protein OG394_37340 [Kribbella sp. NBC_01245]|uniref:hypothetical protein n=1 Tax=Kribbella sp. NBC_01245 TaxID=2903578 RepID=UPI002E2A2FB3|nr:hypothetical protein [Kribbella sp. NBC_01245]